MKGILKGGCDFENVKRVQFNDKPICNFILSTEFLTRMKDDEYNKNINSFNRKLAFLDRIEKFKLLFQDVFEIWKMKRELLEISDLEFNTMDSDECNSDTSTGEFGYDDEYSDNDEECCNDEDDLHENFSIQFTE
uniref:Uncharacterized protein n=1 Tax=Dikerogammarus haemobaphes virus 1 TaxID=2704946 RepID=A0A6G9HEW6_9VIRU|nr:hypothetical protein [Dikerogammarus haemobaphes virus 1]